MMDKLMSETCWAHKKWNKIASDIKLVFHSSTITMMHGPVNIRYKRKCSIALYFFKILSGRGPCDGLIPFPEESERALCVCLWSWNLNNETVEARVGCCATRRKLSKSALKYCIINKQFKISVLKNIPTNALYCNIKFLNYNTRTPKCFDHSFWVILRECTSMLV